MKQAICRADYGVCGMREICRGCAETCGCPFGKQCFIANYIKTGGEQAFQAFKQQLIDEFNALRVPGMPRVERLNALVGNDVNLKYTLSNGHCVRFLNDSSIYLGNQLECEFGGERRFGIVGGMDFLLVCTYEENRTNPELVMYKKR